MRGRWEGPLHVEIRAEANDENPMTILGHAILSCIEEPVDNAIAQTAFFPSSVHALETRKMLVPIFCVSTNHIWVGELEDDIVEVAGKALPHETFHVLEDEATRTKFPHGTNSFGKHVSLVFEGTMLSPQRKWLARGPTCHQIGI